MWYTGAFRSHVSCFSSGRRVCGTSSSSWTGTCLGTHRCWGPWQFLPQQPEKPPFQPLGVRPALALLQWEAGGCLGPPLPPPPALVGSPVLLKARRGTGQGELASRWWHHCHLQRAAPAGGLGMEVEDSESRQPDTRVLAPRLPLYAVLWLFPRSASLCMVCSTQGHLAKHTLSWF